MSLEDALPPSVPVNEPVSEALPKPRSLTCGFCGCRLAPNGDVLARGDAAARYLDLDLDLKKLQEKLDAAVEDARALRETLEARRASARGLDPV